MRTEHVRHHDRSFVIEARGFEIEDTHEAGFDFVQLWLAPQGAEQIEALHSSLSHAAHHTRQNTPELVAASKAEGEALRQAVIASGGARPGQRITIRAFS